MNTPIIFPITYKCNLNCVYCNENKSKYVDYKKSIEVIKTLPNEWVYITGGEPLLIEGIISVCDELRSAGKKVGLTTNGTIDKVEIANHVDRLGVSIDGGKELADKNRGTGTYDLAVEFLKKCVGFTETVIMTTLTKEYKDRQIEEIRDLQKETGCSHIQFTKVK